MNKKAIEGFPLKYVVVALIATLVIALVLEAMGILRGGIISSLFHINNTLANTTAGLPS